MPQGRGLPRVRCHPSSSCIFSLPLKRLSFVSTATQLGGSAAAGTRGPDALLHLGSSEARRRAQSLHERPGSGAGDRAGLPRTDLSRLAQGSKDVQPGRVGAEDCNQPCELSLPTKGGGTKSAPEDPGPTAPQWYQPAGLDRRRRVTRRAACAPISSTSRTDHAFLRGHALHGYSASYGDPGIDGQVTGAARAGETQDRPVRPVAEGGARCLT